MSGAIVTGARGRGRAKPEAAAERPLSDLLAQGWELGHYTAAAGSAGVVEHGFHLRRGAENRLLLVRRKMMGEGLFAEAFDI